MASLELNGTPVEKNNRGHLGPVCNYCGGYGFTNMLSDSGGKSASCPRCYGTGVEPVNVNQLKADIDELKVELQGLKNLIIKEAKRRI